MKCENHRDWHLLKKLNQEYVQKNWFWYAAEVRRLYRCYKTELNQAAYVYTTAETDLETIKSKISSYIYTKRQMSNSHLLVSLLPIKDNNFRPEDECSCKMV